MLAPKPYLREISLKPEKVLDATKYPFTIPAVRHLDGLTFDLDVTFLIGENGAGKSTLLEAISVALGFNAEGGTKNFKFSTRASQSELHPYRRHGSGCWFQGFSLLSAVSRRIITVFGYYQDQPQTNTLHDPDRS